MPSTQKRLVFDLETVGEDFDALDKTTKDSLTRWIEREADSQSEYKLMLDDLKQGLGFSPLTGQIVALGMLDVDTGKAGVYYQSPGVDAKRSEEDGVAYEPMEEKEIVRRFWDVAAKYQVFITFNGRGFDGPFLVTRSAVHGIRPTKNLMAGRYLYQQHADAIHVDLLDQLTFYGATRRKGSLHLWCRAMGIKSPKSGGVTGDDVGDLFKKKKYLDIARYNVGDLHATRELYQKWQEFMNV